jgi:lysophospholipase L1-like esterase
VQRRGLTRWDLRRGAAPTVVCIGDSITRGTSGRQGHRPIVGWVDQFAQLLADAQGLPASGGFRGLWRHDEWERTGGWAETSRADLFDVAPFRQALFSSGSSPDMLLWNKPAAMPVRAFDLYWFQMPGAGDWQYRVDDGQWRNRGGGATLADNRLHKLCIAEEVSQRVAIRGFDGVRPCIAPIAGISTYAESSPRPRAVVHNLGCPATRLAMFCRSSAGDPLALLDDLRPDLVTVLFSNDVLLEDPARFGRELRTLIRRVRVYADVLIIAPYEQRCHRRVDDASTRTDSDVVRSVTASFRPADVGRRVSGANIPEQTTIVSVTSSGSVQLSRAATGSCDLGELTIDVRGDSVMQARYRMTSEDVAFSTGCAFLDLHAAWGHGTGSGWDAAQARGFMADDLHPSQLGHDDIGRRVTAILAATGTDAELAQG